jgi:hypothetical protein
MQLLICSLFHFYTAEGPLLLLVQLKSSSVLPVGEYEAECILPMNFS